MVWHGNKTSQVGLEAGVMEGSDERNEYFIGRLFAYWDQVPFKLPVSFVSGDVLYAKYRKMIHFKDNSLFVSIGGGGKYFDDSLEGRGFISALS